MEFGYFPGIIFALHLLAALSFVLAVFFAIRLYKETDKGWYWLSLLLSAVFFALPQWLRFVLPALAPRLRLLPPILDETSNILASLLFALSCWGMYKTMKHIRKRVE